MAQNKTRSKKPKKLKQTPALNWRKVIPITLIVALAGGLLVWKTFATGLKPYQYSRQQCRPSNQKCLDQSTEALTYRFYRIILNRQPERDGYNFWAEKLMNGQQSPAQVARLMYTRDEVKKSAFAKTSNAQFVKEAHLRAVGTKPNANNASHWKNQLDSGRLSRAGLISQLATKDKSSARHRKKANAYLKKEAQFYLHTPVKNIENPNRPGLIRDGGNGAQLGDDYLWTFGDTLLNPRSADGASLRSNTAGWANLENPTVVSEPLDANKAPKQFIELSAVDSTYNQKSQHPKDRYAIWTGAIIPRPATNDALVYFTRLKESNGYLNYDLLNTGIARVTEGETKAKVLVHNLFKKGERLYGSSGFVHNNYIYLLECPSSLFKKCSLARVKTSDALNKASYTFWDGRNWQSNNKKAAELFPGASSGSGIGWNDDLKKFVIIQSKPFSNEIAISTASQLTGSWSAPKTIYKAPEKIYAGNYHPALSEDGKLFVTYYQQKGKAMGLKSLSIYYSE